MLGDDEINKNISGIRENLQRVVDNHNKYFWSSSRGQLPDIEIVDNSDWYMKMNIIDFLSSVGRNLRLVQNITQNIQKKFFLIKILITLILSTQCFMNMYYDNT